MATTTQNLPITEDEENLLVYYKELDQPEKLLVRELLKALSAGCSYRGKFLYAHNFILTQGFVDHSEAEVSFTSKH